MRRLLTALAATAVATAALAQTFEASPDDLATAREKMLEADQAKAVETAQQDDIASISCRLSTDPVKGRVGSEAVDQVAVTVTSDQASFAALLAAVKAAAADWGSKAEEDLEELGVTPKPKEPEPEPAPMPIEGEK